MDFKREKQIIANMINYQSLPDFIFYSIAEEFISKIKMAKSNNLLEENIDNLFTVIAETIRRKTGKTLRVTQIKGSLALYEGDIVGMKTGEGKTYAAILPAIAKSLVNKGVHIATQNSYLAKRDYEENKAIFEALGLSLGLVSNDDKDIESKKKAYSCDVVYGTSSSFAFDYLLDTIEVKKENIRNESSKRSFLIIDEADNMLLDEAMNPYVISSANLTDHYLYSEQEMHGQSKRFFEEEKDTALVANYMVKLLFDYAKEVDKSIKVIMDSNNYNLVAFDPKLSASYDEKYLLLKNNETKDFKITEKALRVMSYYLLGNRANQLLKTNFKRLNLERDDYKTINNEVVFTLKGYEKALASSLIPELNELYESDEYINEVNQSLSSINNSLKAYFILEKGKDYIVKQNENTGLYEVLLLIDGRAEKGRHFSEGLQMAVELKEETFNNKNFSLNADNHQAASITAASFIDLYDNVSGMSGTPAKEAVKELYNKKVTQVPSYNQYEASESLAKEVIRDDKKDAFYFNEKDRLIRLKIEVAKAYANQRPILIATRSVKDSNYLKNELEKGGFDIEVLNASTKEEARIIASAGKLGKITIATEMAGRGTDIKLGGETEKTFIEEEYDNLFGLSKEEEKKLIIGFIKANKLDPHQDFDKIKNYLRSSRETYDLPNKSNYLKQALISSEKEKEIIVKKGGLLIVGYGHFDLKRVDDQVRGRSARNGDPGETIFLTSYDDFAKMGYNFNKKSLDELKKYQVQDEAGNYYISGSVPEEVFNKIQEKKEKQRVEHIKKVREKEYVKDSIRKAHVKNRDVIVKGEVKESFNIVISEAIDHLVSQAINQKQMLLDDDIKLRKINIDYELLINSIKENLDLDVDINNVKTLGSLKAIIKNQAIKFYENNNFDERVRLKLLEAKDYAFDDFKDRLKIEELNKSFKRDKISKEEEVAIMYKHYDDASKLRSLNAISDIVNVNKYILENDAEISKKK